jgi:hypothetical protein
VLRGAQLFAGIDSSTLPSEPFTVEKASARNVCRRVGTSAKSLD